MLTNEDVIPIIVFIKSDEKNKYGTWELTESSRLVRDARENASEYLLELHIEIMWHESRL